MRVCVCWAYAGIIAVSPLSWKLMLNVIIKFIFHFQTILEHFVQQMTRLSAEIFDESYTKLYIMVKLSFAVLFLCSNSFQGPPPQPAVVTLINVFLSVFVDQTETHVSKGGEETPRPAVLF